MRFQNQDLDLEVLSPEHHLLAVVELHIPEIEEQRKLEMACQERGLMQEGERDLIVYKEVDQGLLQDLIPQEQDLIRQLERVLIQLEQDLLETPQEQDLVTLEQDQVQIADLDQVDLAISLDQDLVQADHHLQEVVVLVEEEVLEEEDHEEGHLVVADAEDKLSTS